MRIFLDNTNINTVRGNNNALNPLLNLVPAKTFIQYFRIILELILKVGSNYQNNEWKHLWSKIPFNNNTQVTNSDFVMIK